MEAVEALREWGIEWRCNPPHSLVGVIRPINAFRKHFLLLLADLCISPSLAGTAFFFAERVGTCSSAAFDLSDSLSEKLKTAYEEETIYHIA